MTPTLRTLVAAAFVVLAAGAPAVGAPSSPAQAAQEGRAGLAAEVERVVFTGRFVRAPRPSVDADGEPVQTYQVAVEEVFGPADVTTRRVTVASTVALEQCSDGVGGTAGQGATPGAEPGGAQQEQATTPPPTTAPTDGPTDGPTDAPTSLPPSPSTGTIDKRLRAFNATRDGSVLSVTGCRGVTLASAAVLDQIVAKFGEGRPPGSAEPPAPPEGEQVGYLCPDTGDALDIDDARSCSALEDDQAFDRSAAPGLALVIVGILGLLLARRMGRPRAR